MQLNLHSDELQPQWFFKATGDAATTHNAIVVGMIGYTDAEDIHLSVITQRPYKAMNDQWFDWYSFGTSGAAYPHS